MKITVEVTESELEGMDIDKLALECSISNILYGSGITKGHNVYIVIVDEEVN